MTQLSKQVVQAKLAARATLKSSSLTVGYLILVKDKDLEQFKPLGKNEFGYEAWNASKAVAEYTMARLQISEMQLPESDRHEYQLSRVVVERRKEETL